MKDLNYVSQEITKGKNLDLNLKQYGESMAALYQGLAYIKLSMNYYTVYDMLNEAPYKESQFNQLLDELNAIIKEDILNNEKVCDTTRIEAVRNRIVHIMEVVTAYVDRLRIYEYVLNRIEYRFSDQKPDEEYYGSYMTNDIIQYILSERDNVVINTKISEIMGQLPMRLSRARFYDYIRDAFSLYHGAQKGTIIDFVYTLRTTAMLEAPKEVDMMFEEIHDIYETLKNADYDAINREEFNRLHGALMIAIEQMTSCADMFVLLEQMVNDVYTIQLTNYHNIGVAEEIQTSKRIIEAVNQAFDSDESDIDSDILDQFTMFEGKQERILSMVQKCDFTIEYAKKNHMAQLNELNLVKEYQALDYVVKLQSGSDFVDLNKDQSLEEIAMDSFTDETCEKFIDELDQMFKTLPQIVRRAVMSTVISQLPVFFNNTQELQQYINLSLEQCHDAAERMAVIDVMRIIVFGDANQG
jgi:hypothetical protein